MAKINTIDGNSSFRLTWQEGMCPFLEEWLNERTGRGEAVSDLEILLESPAARDAKIQQLIEEKVADLKITLASTAARKISDLEILLESTAARDAKIQHLIDVKVAEMQDFLDTVASDVLKSENEKRNSNQDERCSANMDPVGVAPGMESSRNVWPRGKIRLEFFSQEE